MTVFNILHKNAINNQLFFYYTKCNINLANMPGIWLIVLINVTFNNISVKAWMSAVLEEEYPEKTTDLSQVSDKLHHIKLYRVHLSTWRNWTCSFSGDGNKHYSKWPKYLYILGNIYSIYIYRDFDNFARWLLPASVVVGTDCICPVQLPYNRSHYLYFIYKSWSGSCHVMQ